MKLISLTNILLAAILACLIAILEQNRSMARSSAVLRGSDCDARFPAAPAAHRENNSDGATAGQQGAPSSGAFPGWAFGAPRPTDSSWDGRVIDVNIRSIGGSLVSGISGLPVTIQNPRVPVNVENYEVPVRVR